MNNYREYHKLFCIKRFGGILILYTWTSETASDTNRISVVDISWISKVQFI